MLMVPDRTQETLVPIIQQYIRPGTTIWSDQWKVYRNLNKYGYIHDVVNHSKNFVNPLNKQVHTQNIENNWRYLKQTFPKNGTMDSSRG